MVSILRVIAQPNEDEVIYKLLPIGEDRRRNETKTKKQDFSPSLWTPASRTRSEIDGYDEMKDERGSRVGAENWIPWKD